MRGAAEDGAGAVIHEHEIGDPDRDAPIGVERMAHGQAGGEAALLGRLDGGGCGSEAAALRDEGGGVRILFGQGKRYGVLGRQGHEGHAEERVGAGGIDLNLGDALGGLGEREAHAGALAPADPIGLHKAHTLRPAVHLVERRQQVGREAGDAEEPLRELLLLDQRAGTPAAPVDHLLIGEDGAVLGIPVDPTLLTLDQPIGEEIEEEALLLAIVARLAGGEFARPVEREAHALQLGAHGRDIVPGPLRGMDTALARRILGGQAERVPAHRMHHIEAARPAVAGNDITQRVVADMPHMDLARGVREHLEHIVFRAGILRPVGDGEAGAVLPGLLPDGIGGAEVVAGGQRHFGGGRFGSVVHAPCIRQLTLWRQYGPARRGNLPGGRVSWRRSGCGAAGRGREPCPRSARWCRARWWNRSTARSCSPA